MPTVPASALSSEYAILDVLWSVRMSAGSTQAWYTAEYMADVYAASLSLQGYRVGYALKAPLSRGIPLMRNDLAVYSNLGSRGSRLLLYAESVAQDGQGPPALPTAMGGWGRDISLGAFDPQECGGFIWNIPLTLDDAFLGEFHPVAGTSQTDSPYVSRAAGAYICRWSTQAGAFNGEWMRRFDFGQGDGIAEDWNENFLTTVHTPTQFGCSSRNGLATPSVNSDSHIMMCSPSTSSAILPQPDGSLLIESENIPLEFEKTDANDARQYHGGDDYHPVIWPRLRHRTRTIVRWGGRDGVHRKFFESRAPFQVLTNGGCIFHQIHAMMDLFDTAYVMDVANNVVTDLGWNFASDGKCRYTVNSRILNKQKYNPDGTPNGAPVVTAAPHTSNHVAGIVRATGTQFGSNTDFAVAVYVKLNEIGVSSPRWLRPGLDQLDVAMNHKLTAAGFDDTQGQDFLVGTNGINRPSGQIGAQYWHVTGTYANVVSRLRQLYLDGLNPISEWSGQ